MRRGKSGERGIPKNLIPLHRNGLRVRFNGFWLNDSERDRVIANWLDATPNAASVIKDMIFNRLHNGYGTEIQYQEAPPQEHRQSDGLSALMGMED